MNIIITAILGTIAFYEVGVNGSPVTVKIGNWIETSILTIEWSFTFDTLSTSMLIPILYISV